MARVPATGKSIEVPAAAIMPGIADRGRKAGSPGAALARPGLRCLSHWRQEPSSQGESAQKSPRIAVSGSASAIDIRSLGRRMYLLTPTKFPLTRSRPSRIHGVA